MFSKSSAAYLLCVEMSLRAFGTNRNDFLNVIGRVNDKPSAFNLDNKKIYRIKWFINVYYNLRVN